MKKQMSTSAKVRRMIDQGHNNKAIIEKLGVKPQIVYNIRYQINKARGLGAIGTPVPAPVEGIGAPPKRKYTRRVRAGTGITSAPEPSINALPYTVGRPTMEEIRNQYGQAPVRAEGEPVFPITMIEPQTPWQRVKERFANLMRALRG